MFLPIAKFPFRVHQILDWTNASIRTSMTLLRNFWVAEEGQDLIEYTLLMAFVALASAALFLSAGKSVKGIWSSSNSQLSAANTDASYTAAHN